MTLSEIVERFLFLSNEVSKFHELFLFPSGLWVPLSQHNLDVGRGMVHDTKATAAMEVEGLSVVALSDPGLSNEVAAWV